MKFKVLYRLTSFPINFPFIHSEIDELVCHKISKLYTCFYFFLESFSLTIRLTLILSFCHIKHTNISIIQVTEGEQREKKPEKIFEEMIDENFPSMGKETVTQVQEVQSSI